MNESKEMKDYFEKIDEAVKLSYDVAKKARAKSLDPEERVDILLARNMAERVEGLISTLAPQLVGSGMTKRIAELEKKYGTLDWRVALIIAKEVAEEKFCKFKNKKEAMEIGIRTGFAYHTVGIVAAPLEGFVALNIKKRRDGKEYFAIRYASPIRGAGGTAASVSVIIADYIRKNNGYEAYDPDENELNRYVTELEDYHERVTNLQYHPSAEEIKFLIKNIPVEIEGDPTEKKTVSNYKDLPRVDTDRIRGGVALVVSMLALKGPKLWKRISEWGKEFELDWAFMEEFLTIQKNKKSGTNTSLDKLQKITPNKTYIEDLVAGRPILSHPMAAGGFRLRYGRGRTSGFSAESIHPATMILLNKFIATGTQLKIERPGKAAAITACDGIEGPLIKLNDGSVVRIETEDEARQWQNSLKEILFLGDILINYGDFSENGHVLVPPGYCEEWWVKELEKATVNIFGSLDFEKLSELTAIPKEEIDEIINIKNQTSKISAETAIKLSQQTETPLHPFHTYHWKQINAEQFKVFLNWLSEGKIIDEGAKTKKIVLPLEEQPKRILELIGMPHIVATEFVVIEKEPANILLSNLNADSLENLNQITIDESKNGLEIINSLSKIRIKDKSGTFIGARMGRPEKAKMRKLTGNPQVLFPVGKEGGRLRCFQSALEAGKIKADLPINRCDKCKKESIYRVCEVCGTRTKKLYFCKICGAIEEQFCPHGEAATHKMQEIDIKHYFKHALKNINSETYPDLIKGVKGNSNKDKIPENLVKGILRARHGISVNKDGTTRYDMTELPITHFKPEEIRTEIEQLRSLGYTHDIEGKELTNKKQILEIKPQDIILPAPMETLDESADEILFRISKFIDDLLVELYGLGPFYNLQSKNDVIGHLVIGLAPHISAGMIGRIIGFSETQACFAHPLWHAALRRDCDGDECCVILLMDALLNFSRQYLPDKIGGRTMDAPLVLTSKLVPSEVDDMAHGIDVVWNYPLELYEAALECKMPKEIKIEQLKNRLNTEKQYEEFGYTHDCSNINGGVRCSVYKTLPSMEEKIAGQMDLAEKIRAVDASDVARLVIEKHLLKDTKGNLRKFSTQEFRCVKCNEKFRRPPLIGKCTACDGRIIFTVSEGSVIKYLSHSINLAEKYNVDPYLKQTIELTRRRIEGMFGKDKEKQEGLVKWFG